MGAVSDRIKVGEAVGENFALLKKDGWLVGGEPLLRTEILFRDKNNKTTCAGRPAVIADISEGDY